MYNKEAQHHKAQFLYLQTDLTQQEIADLLSIDRKTLYNWIRENKWKRVRYAIKHAPPILIEQFYGQLGALNANIAGREERPYPTKEEADIIRKLTISIKNMREESVSLSDNIEMFIDFSNSLRLKDVHLAQAFVPHIDEYIQGKVKEGQGLDDTWRVYLDERKFDQEYEQYQRDQQIYLSKNRADDKQKAKDAGNPHLPYIPLPENDENNSEQFFNSENSDSENREFGGESETNSATAEPLTVNHITANDNADSPAIKNDVEQGNCYKGHGARYYSGYLEERFNISQDTNVKRVIKEDFGITIIKSLSPLWCLDDSLFFI